MRASITSAQTSSAHTATFSIYFDSGSEERRIEKWRNRSGRSQERARVNFDFTKGIGRVIISHDPISGYVVSHGAGQPKASVAGGRLPPWMVKSPMKNMGVLAVVYDKERERYIVDLPDEMIIERYRDKRPPLITTQIKPKNIEAPAAPVVPSQPEVEQPPVVKEPTRSYADLRRALQDCKELHNENLAEMKSLVDEMNALGHKVALSFKVSGRLVVGITTTEEL